MSNDAGSQSRDTWTVKTTLRPDYYEFFPRFAPHELTERLRRMPFHLATLLTEWNIRAATAACGAAREAFHAFLRLPAMRQRGRLVDVLESVGLSRRVLTAVAKVDRTRHVPPRYMPLAYLNAHIPAGEGTCLSPPGMVALMLERLHVLPGMRVAEFGSGSGYHLACALQLSRPGGHALGIDVREPDRTAGGGGPGPRLIVGDMARPPLRSDSVDAAYCTCYAPDVAAPLSRVVRAGGVLQVVAPIEAAEFDAEPVHSWLLGRFRSYDEYISLHRQPYASVREYRKSEDGTLVRLGVLYDVSFVSARRPADEPIGIRIPDFGA